MTRRVVLLAAQAAVSAALLVWLAKGLDTHALGHLLLSLPPSFVLASLGVIVAGQVLYAWRWWLLLGASGVDVTLGAAIRSYFIGIFANNFLPSTVGGDATKVYYLGRAHGYRTIVASVVVDRMLGLGSLAVLAAVASWLVPPVSARFVAMRLVVTAVAVGSVGLIALAMFGARGGVRNVPRDASLLGKLRRLHRDMGVLLRQPRLIAFGAGLVFVYFLALSLVYLWFMDVSGVARPSFVAVFTAVAMTGVLSNVPISLNGLGVREQLHAWLFAPLGVPKEAAVAISLLLFGHILLTSLVGMVLWLMQPAPATAAAGSPVAEAAEENA
jgi:glycosyltransferase 2 family protein